MQTTQAEIIEAAQNFELREEPYTLLEALNVISLNGLADDQTGNVDAPTGHVYRVSRWIVQTDSQGFSHITEHSDEEQARCDFSVFDAAYTDWDEAMS